MNHTRGLDGGHETFQELLPWYVTGKLDAEDAARFETHLAECAECGAELVSERALGRQLAGLSMPAERGWTALRQRIANDDMPDEKPAAHPATRQRHVMRWLLGAQTVAIVSLALVIAVPQFNKTPQYHALGTASDAQTGNLLVMFRPETPERELRRIIHDSGARFVDGPTSTDAYVLRVADAGRTAALAKLRTEQAVVLAEPIDAGARP